MSTEAPLDLKSTINLPRTGFAQKANLVQREPARLERWRELDLYNRIKEVRRGRPLFILHDGPPYANSDIHIGTAMNKILKDFIVKSRSMMGFDAPYIPGYDCHGLPIELHVEKKLGSKRSEMSALAIRQACRDHAAKALLRQTTDFQRLGILGEWDNPYITMSNAYEAETARLFGRFIERGFVYRGSRPVYWCLHDQTALAEAEVEYREHDSPSIYVKFPLPADQVADLERRIGTAAITATGKPTHVLIWTTTPWTLPANLGIAVNPNFDYVAIDTGAEVYIVAADLASAVAEKVGIESFRELARFRGHLLDLLRARHAWLDRVSLLMVGEHVTLGGESDAETELDVADSQRRGTGKSGTGCVHTAPGHGHDDFVIGQQYRSELEAAHAKLRGSGAMPDKAADVYCPVDDSGRFTGEVERFAGMTVFEANGPIVEYLREIGALVFTESYVHRYPHCWRCHGPVIFRATPQWFISMDRTDEGGVSLREGALREVESVRWIPGWGRDRMWRMLEGRPDWCVSRQRVWGVPIPAFHCQGCGHSIADAAVVSHVAGIFENESSDAWYSRSPAELLPEGFKCPVCGGSEFSKEMDILDVWFDSGSSSLAVLERERGLPWPADVYLEGPDQFRGWFSSSLLVALAAHDRAPFRTVVTHGWTVDGEGKAMHKSLGNAISPNEVIDVSGAEILRLWVASSNYQEDVRLSKEILKRLVDAYRKIRNTARYALGNIFDFEPERDRVAREDMLEIDRWALAVTDEITAKVLEGYERFEYHQVYHALYQFATVTLSAIYFDILKDRLYTFAPRSIGRRSAQTALHEIVERLARLIAPILAFTADEIWENIPGTGVPSVHMAEFPEAAGRESDRELVARWDRLLSVRSQVQKHLEEKRNEKVIGASLEAAVRLRAGGGDLYVLLDTYREELCSILIVSQVTLELMDQEGLEIEVTHAEGSKCERCWNWSTTVGLNAAYPTLDARCVRQVEQGWGGTGV